MFVGIYGHYRNSSFVVAIAQPFGKWEGQDLKS